MSIMIKQQIGLVGVGNMGTSILEGVLKNRLAKPSKVWVYDKIASKARQFVRKTGVRQAASAEELLGKTNIILLAMKPQDFPAFANEAQNSLKAGYKAISILAGLTTDGIKKALGGKVTVVRAMPNLGAKIGESMTAICGGDRQTNAIAAKLFYGCGKVVSLSEKQFDLVTAISGSGPAYFFHLMELLEDFGKKQGLPASVAATLAVQTAVGASLLARSAGVPCEVLRQRVTSKKGTTDAALKVLKKKQFGRIFQQALMAAAKRSAQLRRGK